MLREGPWRQEKREGKEVRETGHDSREEYPFLRLADARFCLGKIDHTSSFIPFQARTVGISSHRVV